jgi:hypothetical protein
MQDKDAACHILCTKHLVQVLRTNATPTTSLCVKASVHPDLRLWLKQTSFLTYSIQHDLHEVEKMD